MMQRERRKVQPPIQVTLEDTAVYLINASYRKYSLELGPQQRALFDGIRDGCLFFVFLGILQKAEDMGIISTGPSIVHHPLIEGSHGMPCGVLFDANLTRQTYTGVLRYTKQLLDDSHISSVLCDYELALRQAVQEEFL